MERRTRALLLLTLSSSLLVNVLLLGGAAAFAWWFWSDPAPTPAPTSTPITVVTQDPDPTPTPAPTPTSAGADSTPVTAPGAGSSATPEPAVGPAPLEALRTTVGLTPAEWQRVTEGEVVLRRVQDAGSFAIQGWFLARGTPERALDLLTSYADISRIYTDVQRTHVLDRGALRARVHYEAKLGPLKEQWVVDERWTPTALSWKQVIDPKRPSRLTRTEGFWRLHPVGDRMLLLWYRNAIEFHGVPDAIVRRLTASTIPGIADRIRRALAR